MREDQLARKPVPQDHDNPAGPIPADEISVGNQVEGIDEVPADVVAKARADVAREDMSPQHQEGFRRLAAIQHVLEKEQRLLTYREADIHKSVRWFLDIVQGIEKRKSRLQAMTAEAAQHAEALQSASPDLATAHVTAIEQLAKQVEANIATLPELPTASELPFYKERTEGEDIVQRKHNLLQLVEDLKYTLRNVTARDANERNELHQLDVDIAAARNSLGGVYSEDNLQVSEQTIQGLLVRAQVEHNLPDALAQSPDNVPSPDAIRAEVRMFELNQQLLQFIEDFKKPETLAAINDPEEKSRRLRQDLIALFNDIAPRREDFDKILFRRVSDAIKETQNIDFRLALRSETGDTTLQDRQESSAAKLYSFGSKRQGKMPKLRKPDYLRIESWPEHQEYSFNTLGEDYVELDPSINAMVVCDGNSTGECSADAARLVAQRVMEIFRGIPSGASFEDAQAYVNGRVSELATILDSLESNGGTTVLAARYFPEFNAAVLIDIGDCEAYISNQDGTKRLASSLDGERSTDAVQLTLARGDNGKGRISDSRKLKANNFVRNLSLLPGEALSLITDGPRNNSSAELLKLGLESVIDQVAQPVVVGGEPNVNALPKALNKLPNGKSGDDASGAILFAKAAA